MIQSVTAQQTQPVGTKKKERKKREVQRHIRGRKYIKEEEEEAEKTANEREDPVKSNARERKSAAVRFTWRGWISSLVRTGGERECYPQPMESRVVIEELHLFWWQGSQHFLDGKELVNLTLSWEKRLPVTQLS